MSAEAYERIRDALGGPSDHRFVCWLLDETEGVCAALEHVLQTLSGNSGALHPGLNEQECALAIYEKLAASLADPASQELTRRLQDRYVLVGATMFDLAQAFGKTRPRRLRALLASLCANAPWLEAEIEAASDLYIDQLVQFREGYSLYDSIIQPPVDALNAEIKLQQSMAQSWLSLAAFCQMPASVLLHDDRYLYELSKAYDAATSLQLGLSQKAGYEPSSEAASHSVLIRQLKWQWTGLSFCILQSLLAASNNPATPSSDSGVLLTILDDMHTADASLVPFCNAPLLLDMEFRFGLRKTFADASLVSNALDQAQLDYITMSIDQLVGMADPPYQNGLRDLELRTDQARAPLCAATATSSENSAILAATAADFDAEAALQVKELLPDLGDGFIRACLDYYGHSAEAAVVAIFEGNLPPSLAEMDRAATHWERPMSTEESASGISAGAMASSIEGTKQTDVLSSRKNIFDKDEFDIFHHNSLDWSRVQQGKSKTRISLKAPDTEFKTRIMEIAQRIEEDDEYDDTYDHTAQDITASAIDTKDDVDASSNGQHLPEHKPRAKAATDPIKPWEATLVRLYAEDPALFERKREIRKSPARMALCKQTGLTHEQIEGWYIMFRRNPRHQHIVDRHLMNANRPDARRSLHPAVNNPSDQDSVEEDGRKHTQEASAQPTKRDFRSKDKNKAKIGNHDRKKQQARKARNAMGGPPPS
ncbi:hypothetical protein IW152_003569 [Coemansia sp. BCRC 34962]|nr:hypothetical protein IW152_003569 [Coemansia sp. BCRC 34962]